MGSFLYYFALWQKLDLGVMGLFLTTIFNSSGEEPEGKGHYHLLLRQKISLWLLGYQQTDSFIAVRNSYYGCPHTKQNTTARTIMQTNRDLRNPCPQRA